jgi:3-oxoacyl-[acyl-carrier-protein] synthase II
MRRVAITGVGVVSPIGCGVEAFFDGLRQARAGVGPIQSFDASAFPTRIAGEVRDLPAAAASWPEPDLAAALARDPKSRYGLAAGREALRGAFGDDRPVRHHPAERMGVMLAAGLEVFHLQDIVAHAGGDGVDGAGLLASLEAAPSMSRLQIPADLAARCLRQEAGAAGPLAVNVSACAAATQSLGEAMWAIREGALDLVISGGYDSMVNPLGVGGFSMLEALSTANDLGGGASRPFHRHRDGFVLGEGAAVFVLEERELARRRGATIVAELLGYGSTMDAYRVTDPAPDHAGAAAAMIAALQDAGLPQGHVDYVNAHGTGTVKNDQAEIAAIRCALGASAERIPVSSTKSQIGHLIGAAGAVELAAVIFALQQGIVPATINLTDPDPACDLDCVALTPRPAEVRTALSNSFGFGGQNAAIVVGAPQC